MASGQRDFPNAVAHFTNLCDTFPGSVALPGRGSLQSRLSGSNSQGPSEGRWVLCSDQSMINGFSNGKSSWKIDVGKIFVLIFRGFLQQLQEEQEENRRSWVFHIRKLGESGNGQDGHMTLVASYAMEPGDEVSISHQDLLPDMVIQTGDF